MLTMLREQWPILVAAAYAYYAYRAYWCKYGYQESYLASMKRKNWHYKDAEAGPQEWHAEAIWNACFGPLGLCLAMTDWEIYQKVYGEPLKPVQTAAARQRQINEEWGE